jgi:transposase
MPAALLLREDFDALTLRSLAARSRDAKHSRRLLSIAAVYDGMTRGEAAKIGGMTRQILRDWVVRFNEWGPEGLHDLKGSGSKRRLDDEGMAALAQIVEAGPDPEVDGLVRWRLIDLCGIIEQRFRVSYKERGMSRLLKQLGFSNISGRPQHPAQDPQIIDAFKKTSPVHLRQT